MTLRFFELTSDQHSSGVFDAPFSESELSRALSKCHDSAPGLDGLRYSTFQQHLPWWRAMLQSPIELECGAISLEASVRLSPSSRMVTQRTQTDIDQFLWLLVRSRFSRG